ALPMFRNAVAVPVPRWIGVERTRVLAVVLAVAVGVHSAGIDAGIGGVIWTGVDAVGHPVAVAIGLVRIAGTQILAVVPPVSVGIRCARIGADPTQPRAGGIHLRPEMRHLVFD